MFYEIMIKTETKASVKNNFSHVGFVSART